MTTKPQAPPDLASKSALGRVVLDSPQGVVQERRDGYLATLPAAHGDFVDAQDGRKGLL